MTENLTIITLNQPDITDFAQARNKLLEKAKTDWVLFLDSDEVLTSSLKKEINTAIKNQHYNYQLKRRDWFLNRQLRFGETAAVRLTRLIQKGTGRWQGSVHEIFQSNLPLKTLRHPLVHQRHLTFSQFLDRLNRYSSLRAQAVPRFSLFQLLVYPSLKFIQNYLFRLGFLDSLPGLAMALAMSLHSLVVRVKQYEIQRTK